MSHFPYCLVDLIRFDGAARGPAPNVVAACVAIFCAYIPISAVTVALTPIAASLRASTRDLTWVLDAFVLPMAAFILTAGTVADIHGRKKVLLGGLALVAIGSVVGLVWRWMSPRRPRAAVWTAGVNSLSWRAWSRSPTPSSRCPSTAGALPW